MRREAIKVPSILGMHETPMSTRSMRMFRTNVQGQLDRGSLKTQICHGWEPGAVMANCEGNELPQKADRGLARDWTTSDQPSLSGLGASSNGPSWLERSDEVWLLVSTQPRNLWYYSVDCSARTAPLPSAIILLH